jgi:hypothetical protein
MAAATSNIGARRRALSLQGLFARSAPARPRSRHVRARRARHEDGRTRTRRRRAEPAAVRRQALSWASRGTRRDGALRAGARRGLRASPGTFPAAEGARGGPEERSGRTGAAMAVVQRASHERKTGARRKLKTGGVRGSRTPFPEAGALDSQHQCSSHRNVTTSHNSRTTFPALGAHNIAQPHMMAQWTIPALIVSALRVRTTTFASYAFRVSLGLLDTLHFSGEHYFVDKSAPSAGSRGVSLLNVICV